jgi:hypothetical protein
MYFGYCKKEKTVIFLTRVVVFEDGVILWPVCNFKFYDFLIFQKRIGDIILSLQSIQNRNCLVLELTPEPAAEILQSADPFTSSCRIGNMFHTTAG